MFPPAGFLLFRQRAADPDFPGSDGSKADRSLVLPGRTRGTASGVRCGACAHSSPATLLGGRIQGGPTIFADAAFALYSGAL